MKIGAYVAHDDDSVLAVGGQIFEHIKKGDDVYIVIFTDGRHSHKAVLGIEENPTPLEVKEARHWEIIRALAFLGVKSDRIYFLDQTDADGEAWKNDAGLLDAIHRITGDEYPDVIYFHASDTHNDHRAVNSIMMRLFGKLCYKPKAYSFLIWVKELTRPGPEFNLNCIPETDIPEGAIIKRVEPDVMARKRAAIYTMQSQVLNWPYQDWQPQEKPILGKDFINYFLRGEEVLVEIQ